MKKNTEKMTPEKTPISDSAVKFHNYFRLVMF